MFWIAKDNLQAALIGPFEGFLRAKGCAIQYGRKLIDLRINEREAKVTGLRFENVADVIETDQVILAIPVEKLVELLNRRGSNLAEAALDLRTRFITVAWIIEPVVNGTLPSK